MNNIICDSVGILLKSVNYEYDIAKKHNKVEFEDEFKIVKVQQDLAEFQISRKLVVDLQVAYTLNIVAGLQVYAQEGIDLTKHINDEFIEKNKDDLSKSVIVFISSLITQITGSFNGIPVITTPKLTLK